MGYVVKIRKEEPIKLYFDDWEPALELLETIYRATGEFDDNILTVEIEHSDS